MSTHEKSILMTSPTRPWSKGISATSQIVLRVHSCPLKPNLRRGVECALDNSTTSVVVVPTVPVVVMVLTAMVEVVVPTVMVELGGKW